MKVSISAIVFFSFHNKTMSLFDLHLVKVLMFHQKNIASEKATISVSLHRDLILRNKENKNLIVLKK